MGLSLSSCSQQFHPIQWLLKILSLSCSGGYQLWDLNFLTPSHILINMVCLFLEWCVIDRPFCVHWWCSNLGLRQPTTFTVLEPQFRIVSGSFLWVLRQSLKKFVGILGWFACFLTSLSGIQTLQCHGDTTQMCCASFVLLWFILQTTSNMALFLFLSFYSFSLLFGLNPFCRMPAWSHLLVGCRCLFLPRRGSNRAPQRKRGQQNRKSYRTLRGSSAR